MNTDTRSRKWQITINNPLEHGFNHEIIIANLEHLKSLVYYCGSDEVGEQGTPHTHVYVYCSGAVRFERMKKLFPPAHFELARGTSQENKEYIQKTGKWAGSHKSESSVEGSFFEFGDVPAERQGQRNDIADLYDMVKQGMSNYEIMEASPQFMFNIDKIDKIRQIVRAERFKTEWRNLQVTYIYGSTGSGKTRFVMDSYGYENVYRVSNYDHPFDLYNGEDVVIFEEFRSSLKIQDMLNFLDGYPLYLPCRYADKVACFTKVYLITNIPLKEQYTFIQRDCPETYRAFKRRIGCIQRYEKSFMNIEQDNYTHHEGGVEFLE